MSEAYYWKPTILNSCSSQIMTDASLYISVFIVLILCFTLSVKTVDQIGPVGNSPDLTIPFFLWAAVHRSRADYLVCDSPCAEIWLKLVVAELFRYPNQIGYN